MPALDDRMPVGDGPDERERVVADLRMPVLAVAAWAGALLALLPASTAIVVLACVVVAASGAVRRRGRGAVAMVLACGVVAGGVWCVAELRAEAVGGGPVAELADQRAAVDVTGVLVSDVREVDGGFGDEQVAVRLRVTQVVGRGQRHEVSAPVLVIGDPAWADEPLGTTVRAGGRLVPSDDDDLAGLLTGARPPDRLAESDVWWRGAGAVRASIRDAVAHRPDDQRALVPALVDGDDAGLSEELEADFRATGLTHLTAVSGTNLTLLVGFLLVLARWVGVRGRWLVLVAALGIVGFVLLARTEPSVVRAAAMGAVGLVAMSSNGRGRAVRALSVAVVGLLLVQPALATEPGFVLSVLATAGIVLLAPGWRDALARWLPRWLAEAVAVPAAAQVACTPVVAAISGQVSLVAVVCNLVVAPVVGPATVLGLGAGLVALVSDPAGQVLGTGAGWCVGWIVAVARAGADLPLATVDWSAGGWSLAVLTALCVGLCLVAPVLLARPRLAVPGSLVLVVVVVVPLPTPGWPAAGWAVAMCDVGQGDALVLRAGPRVGCRMTLTCRGDSQAL